MKLKIIIIIVAFICMGEFLSAKDSNIYSLNMKNILEVYNGPIEKLRELENAENDELLSDNRIRINFLNRHIDEFKVQSESNISDYLKGIYRNAIIRLYNELDRLQNEIIQENINSINELSIYLAQIKNKKTDQDEILEDISKRVSKLRCVMADLSDTFDSYDQIIKKQNGLIESVLELRPEVYKNTLFLLPGLAAGDNLTPYISLGLGYIANEGRFSYGGIIEAGFSPGEKLVNVGVAVILGFNYGKI